MAEAHSYPLPEVGIMRDVFPCEDAEEAVPEEEAWDTKCSSRGRGGSRVIAGEQVRRFDHERPRHYEGAQRVLWQGPGEFGDPRCCNQVGGLLPGCTQIVQGRGLFFSSSLLLFFSYSFLLFFSFSLRLVFFSSSLLLLFFSSNRILIGF